MPFSIFLCICSGLIVASSTTINKISSTGLTRHQVWCFHLSGNRNYRELHLLPVFNEFRLDFNTIEFKKVFLLDIDGKIIVIVHLINGFMATRSFFSTWRYPSVMQWQDKLWGAKSTLVVLHTNCLFSATHQAQANMRQQESDLNNSNWYLNFLCFLAVLQESIIHACLIYFKLLKLHVVLDQCFVLSKDMHKIATTDEGIKEPIKI